MSSVNATSLPGALLSRAQADPNGIAAREFRLGIWQETTWKAHAEEVASIASGLSSSGIGENDVVALIAQNGQLWTSIEIAVQSLGATICAIPPDLAPATTKAIVAEVGAKVAIVGDQEQFDKINTDRPTALVLLVVLDTRGLRTLNVVGRSDANETATLEQLKSKRTTTVTDSIGQARPESRALILAAVSDDSQTVRLDSFTHSELIAQGVAAQSSLGLTDREQIVSQSSLADPVEHAISVVASLLVGFPVNFGEVGLESAACRQVQPTILYPNSQWLRGCVVDTQAQTSGAVGLKRRALGKLSQEAGTYSATPQKDLGASGHSNPARMVGIGTALLAFVFLLVSTGMNDFLRLLIVIVLIVAAGLFLVVSGISAPGGIRRRYGLNRCRAVLSSAVGSEGPFLSVLQIPAVDFSVSTGSKIGEVRSEVLS
jgi:AMP-binding enzyme